MDLLNRSTAVPTGRDLALCVGFLSISLLGACSDGASPAIPIVPDETSLRAENSSTGKSSRSALPAAVTDLSVASTSAYSVMLEWTAVDDGTNAPAAYEVRFAPTPMGGWHEGTVVVAGDCASPPEGSKVGATVSCAVEGLDPATGYDFQLLAFREKKNGKRMYSEDLSNVVTAETYPITPGPVEDLSVAGVTDASVTLGWTEVGDGAGSPALYELRYTMSASDHTWNSATVVSAGSCATPMSGSEIGATRTCMVPGLAPGVAYDFQLGAFREEDDGSRVYAEELSNVATAVTEPEPSGVPLSVSDLGVRTTTASSVTLAWTEVGDGSGVPADYQVRFALTPLGYGWGDAAVVAEGSCADPVSGSELDAVRSCTVEGLEAATSYDFQLVAFREEDDGSRVYAEDLSNVATGATLENLTGDGGSVDTGGGTGSHPYEPADFAPITETSYASATEDGWSASSSMTVVDDPSAPRSPGSVGQAHYPAGFAGGHAPIWSERGISNAGARRLYVSFWLKVSDNWQGNSVNDKIAYFWTHQKPVVFPVYVGGGSNPLYSQIRIQDVPDGARNFAPNLADPRIHRGEWHRWEIVVASNSGDAADGEIHWWIDGAKVGEYHDVRFGTSSQSKIWNYVSWRPVWGGSGGVIQDDQYMWMDHTYVSGAP